MGKLKLLHGCGLDYVGEVETCPCVTIPLRDSSRYIGNTNSDATRSNYPPAEAFLHVPLIYLREE